MEIIILYHHMIYEFNKRGKIKMKTTILTLLTICTIALNADAIPDPDKYNTVERKVMVTNIDDYPNMQLLGCIEAMVGDNVTYSVEQNISLRLGYKHNRFRFLGIKKDLLNEFGGINTKATDNIYESSNEELSEKLVQLSISKKSPQMITNRIIYVDKKYPMKTDDYYYEIIEGTDANLTLKLKKRIIGFSDGSTDKIINY